MSADFHKEPWFWVSGSRKQIHLADVVFALTFLAFQNSLEQFLGQVEATISVTRRCGCIFGTGEVVQETVPCPTYMDDSTILMEADSQESLLVGLAMVTKGTSRIASDFGFRLDLAPRKTEAVVSWVGPGSRPIRRRLMALSNNRQFAMLPLNTRLDDEGDVQFPALAEKDRAVRIVQSYRHLGKTVQAGASMGREIASRANAGQAATHALARRLLGNEGLPRHVRVQVAKACVASRRLHQGGTWDELQGHQLQRLKVAWSRPWRIIAGAIGRRPQDEMEVQCEVQNELQVAESEDELPCMRLL